MLYIGKNLYTPYILTIFIMIKERYRMSNNKNVTPLKAIRKECLKCMNESKYEVRLCTRRECEFYDYRFDKMPKDHKKRKKTKLQLIKSYCLNCGEGTYADVRKCPHTGCPCYIFRNGRLPDFEEADKYTGDGTPVLKSETRSKVAKEANNLKLHRN